MESRAHLGAACAGTGYEARAGSPTIRASEIRVQSKDVLGMNVPGVDRRLLTSREVLT